MRFVVKEDFFGLHTLEFVNLARRVRYIWFVLTKVRYEKVWLSWLSVTPEYCSTTDKDKWPVLMRRRQVSVRMSVAIRHRLTSDFRWVPAHELVTCVCVSAKMTCAPRTLGACYAATRQGDQYSSTADIRFEDMTSLQMRYGDIT